MSSSKFLKKTFSVFMIFICSFQMAFADTIMRLPASFFEDEILESLTTEMKEFGIALKGKDITPECADGQANTIQEQIAGEDVDTESFFDRLEDLEQNSCGHLSYKFQSTEEISAPVAPCSPIHEKGLLDEIIEKITKLEEDKKEVKRSVFSSLKPKYKQAIVLKNSLERAIINENIDEEERRKLVVLYLNSVVMNMRDMVVIQQAYFPNSRSEKIYTDLLPELPDYLFSSEDDKDLLRMGNDPSANPFYLEINESVFGNTTLSFKPALVIRRDLVTLMKAPTLKNYLKALKLLTLQMMISQRATYKAILEEDTNISIPRACQTASNGNFPSEVKLNFEEGEGDNYVTNILASNGLIPSSENYLFQEYYLENIDKDPTVDGYSGLIAFQEIKNAMEGLKKNNQLGLTVSLDDVTHFDRVKNLKMSEVMEVFQYEQKNRRDKREGTHEMAEIMEKILAVPTGMESYEYADGGDTVVLNPSFSNLSIYLAELMVRKKVEHFSELISDRLYDKLKSNKSIIKMPSLYGASIWRQYALKEMAKITNENKNVKKSSRIYRYFHHACSKITAINTDAATKKFCGSDKRNSHIIASAAEFLNDFNNIEESFVPTERLEESGYVSIYPTIALIWHRLVRAGFIESASQSEYDFLTVQMEELNPWARVRLGYLVAMDELEHVKNGHQPTYKNTRRGRKQSKPTQCFYKNVNSMITHLEEAGEVLKLDRPLSPSYADAILSKNEKNVLWQTIVDENNEGSVQLFSTKAKGKSFYEYSEAISKSTLLSREQVENLADKLPYGITGETYDQIDEVLDSENGQFNQFYLDLYKTKGDIDSHIEYFTDHAFEYGLDDKYSAKAGFLMLDTLMKKPVYKSIMQEAASQRENDVENAMEKLCQLKDDEHEEFKAIFYATSKAQNQLNEMGGLPAVPENVLNKINKMSKEEWTDVKLGLGAGLLGAAAVMVGALCTAASGGICAPLGVAMMAAGASAMGMQVTLVGRELNRKRHADGYSSDISQMEELGFANSGSAYEVSRTWFWTSFELISIIPIVGVVTKSIKGGSKIAYASSRTFMRKAGQGNLKEARRAAGEAGQAAYVEEEVMLAKYVLGFKKLSDNPAIVSVQSKVKKIRQLFSKGHITSDEMAKRIGKVYDNAKAMADLAGDTAHVSKVIVKESVEEINAKTVETVTKYFNNSPESMNRLLRSYTKRIGLHGDRLSWARRQNQLAQNGDKMWGTNWFYKLRYETLAKNGVKMRKMIDELELISRRGDNFDEFVLRNIDDLTDIFMKIPLRKRELPYLILLQGGPHMGGPLMGKRLPMLGDLADGIMVKKIFTARSRLVTETLKREARELVKLPNFVAAEGSLRAVKVFSNNIEELITASSKEKAKSLKTELKTLEEKLAEKALRHAQNHLKDSWKIKKLWSFIFLRHKGASLKEISKQDIDVVRRIIFNPANDNERALGEVLWSAVDPEDMFDIPQIGEFAYKAAKELSNYKNVSEFDRYLNALRILVIQKNPGKVEIM
jgi:hypothetical protein